MGKHLPRNIQLAREQKRLERVARDLGYESSGAMYYEMYVVQRIPLHEISQRLYTPLWSLRKRFDELGITVNKRGGANNVKFELTDELMAEVNRDGISAVCDRLGVNFVSLYLRVRERTRQGRV